MGIGSTLADAIQRASARYGISSGYLSRLSLVESSGNTNAYNSSSGASGAFQFVRSTAKQFNLTNPFDPYSSADAAARLTVSNKNYLQRVLGRAPSDGELYLAHQQGAAGAAKLLTNPNGDPIATIGSQAFYGNGGTNGMSNADFAARWTTQFDGTETSDALGTIKSPNLTGGAPDSATVAATIGGNTASDAGAGSRQATWIAVIESYFVRGLIVVLGLVFVAVGLALFKTDSIENVVKTAAKF